MINFSSLLLHLVIFDLQDLETSLLYQSLAVQHNDIMCN